MDKFKVIFLGTACLVACFAVPAGAMGNIHFGKLEIHPYASLQELLNDNVYSTSTDPKSDRISQITPGVQLQFPFGVHRMEADYHLKSRKYGTYRGESTEDHFANGAVELYFGGRLSLKIDDTYSKDHEERNESATGFIDGFRINAASVTAAYQLAGRSKVQVDYRRTNYNFMVADFRDRDEDLVAGYVYYRFLPKTSAFVEYDRRTIDYSAAAPDLDNTMKYILLGMTWEATARSKGTVKAGKVTKTFEDSAVEGPEKIVAFIDIDHKFTEYTSLLLSAKRDVNETRYFGATYYVTTGFAAEFKHRFGAKLSGIARMSYGKDEFSPQTTTRIDKTMMEGAGLRYLMHDWIEIGADYGYRSRNSNIDVNDFREKQSVLSVNLVF